MFGFFQSSFSAVVESMVESGRATKEEADFIAKMKDQRDQFANEDIEQIKSLHDARIAAPRADDGRSCGRASTRSDCICGTGTAPARRRRP